MIEADLVMVGNIDESASLVRAFGSSGPKVEVHKAICKRGAFIGFDRQGGQGDARQVPMVLALIDAGYAGNLLFSSDLSTANQIKHNGGTGYAKTVTVFVPKLREAGVVFLRFELGAQRGVFLYRRTLAFIAVNPGHLCHKKRAI